MAKRPDPASRSTRISALPSGPGPRYRQSADAVSDGVCPRPSASTGTKTGTSRTVSPPAVEPERRPRGVIEIPAFGEGGPAGELEILGPTFETRKNEGHGWIAGLAEAEAVPDGA